LIDIELVGNTPFAINFYQLVCVKELSRTVEYGCGRDVVVNLDGKDLAVLGKELSSETHLSMVSLIGRLHRTSSPSAFFA
jgi:hypothetical protein